MSSDSLKLRPNWQRKVKPIVDNPLVIPMPVIVKLIEYEGSFLKKFLCLSKEFRKRLLKQMRADFKIVIERLKTTYTPMLMFESCYLESTPIKAGNRVGTRIDFVIKLKLNEA